MARKVLQPMAMITLLMMSVALSVGTGAQDPPDQPSPAPSLNVNERYVVESVEVEGVERDKVSGDTRKLMDELVGQKMAQEKLDAIAKRLGDEFKKRKVSQRVVKGSKAEHVKVVFVVAPRSISFSGDSDDFRLLYHSKLNWTFGGTARIPVGGRGFGLLAGALTDNDLRVERYSGIRGGFDQKLWKDHVRVGLVGETYRTQWNGAALAAAEESLIYRVRQNLEPVVEIRPLPNLWLKAGFSFQRFEFQFPAARYQSAHSVISSLRFEREWIGNSVDKQSLEAGYDLRAATRDLGGEFAYNRHAWNARYAARVGPSEFIVEGRFGTLGGLAPLTERFVLGNTQTLRGWSRFDVAPLGGNRMAHGSAEYRYRGFRFLYDQGAVGNGGTGPARRSFGLGYIDDGLTLVVAFPLRNGNVTPLVMLGYTF